VRLFNASKAAGIPRLLFVSSFSAFDGCRSIYGATKLAVEKQSSAMGVCSVRLGFVCDNSGVEGKSGGLSGSLEKLATLPLIPLPGGGKQNLFAVMAGDLGPAFSAILGSCDHSPVSVAHPAPVSLRKMMTIFARRKGRKAVFLPFPWRLLWLPLRVAETAGLRLPFRSDSLVSLMNQNPAPDFSVLQNLNIGMRPFADEG
jgi:nucleoside-diphosphate-sugar epimerase